MPERPIVFVLRVWARSGMRGSLQLVVSGEVRYFASLDQLTRLLQEVAARPEAPAAIPPDEAGQS